MKIVCEFFHMPFGTNLGPNSPSSRTPPENLAAIFFIAVMNTIFLDTVPSKKKQSRN
jgi:hypothetical protein